MSWIILATDLTFLDGKICVLCYSRSGDFLIGHSLSSAAKFESRAHAQEIVDRYKTDFPHLRFEPVKP